MAAVAEANKSKLVTDVVAEIQALKKKQDAVILAHYSQAPDIQDIAVGTNDHGTPIYLRDVGRVQLGPDIRRGVSELDGVGDGGDRRLGRAVALRRFHPRRDGPSVLVPDVLGEGAVAPGRFEPAKHLPEAVAAGFGAIELNLYFGRKHFDHEDARAVTELRRVAGDFDGGRFQCADPLCTPLGEPAGVDNFVGG